MGLRTFFAARRGRRLAGSLPPYQEGRGHVVQFYPGEFPAGDVARFVRDGVALGEVALLVATPEHTLAVDALLGDLRAKVIYLDADKTLASFMSDGHPDRLRFLDTVGDLVQQAADAGNGRVRAFGEMVVLLCERGQPAAAHELEGLWNGLAASHDLRLLCSYPMTALSGGNRGFAEALRDTHAAALPA